MDNLPKSFLKQVEHRDCKHTRFRTTRGTEFDKLRTCTLFASPRISPGNPLYLTTPKQTTSPNVSRKRSDSKPVLCSRRANCLGSSGSNSCGLQTIFAVLHRDVTPHEACTGKPLDLSHLRIIGQGGYCQVHLGSTGWSEYQGRAHDLSEM